jgi:SAM-dependent methyltransferase
MHMPQALNLGCGVSYLKDPLWLNMDWQSNSKWVTRRNLLKKFPLLDGETELVYSSHLVEHLTKEDARWLLAECHRVLKPGGTIRLSLPDFEEMARAYLMYLDIKEYKKSQFVLTEILDQCVRLRPSGSFPTWYKMALDDESLYDFIESRTGRKKRKLQESGLPKKSKLSCVSIQELLIVLTRARGYVSWRYIRLITKLLPAWFRDYHVSFATPGERHMWLYDFAELSRILKMIGFENIEKVVGPTTRSRYDSVLTLDFDPSGFPLKGLSTMFVEASKPR